MKFSIQEEGKEKQVFLTFKIFGKLSKETIQSSSDNLTKKFSSSRRKKMKNFAHLMEKNSYLFNNTGKDLEFLQQFFLIKSQERKNISLTAMK